MKSIIRTVVLFVGAAFLSVLWFLDWALSDE